jgi:hypothetical protein
MTQKHFSSARARGRTINFYGRLQTAAADTHFRPPKSQNASPALCFINAFLVLRNATLKFAPTFAYSACSASASARGSNAANLLLSPAPWERVGELVGKYQHFACSNIGDFWFKWLAQWEFIGKL